MRKLVGFLACLQLAPLLVQAAPFTQYVACDGASYQLNSDGIAPIICRGGGYFAEANAYPPSLQLSADAEKDFPFPPGIDEARTTVAGIYTIVPADPAARFFNPCLRAQINGGGGQASFSFGTYTLQSPCDFAHASPDSLLGAVAIFGTAFAATETQTGVGPQLRFYDSNGNPVGSSYTALFRPDLPEPSTGLLLAIGLACIGTIRACKALSHALRRP